MPTIISVKQYAKVINGQIHLKLPEGFECEEVEVIIMPRDERRDSLHTWERAELYDVGKIGQSILSFPDDDEDYSEW